jgi:hypothetical protein
MAGATVPEDAAAVAFAVTAGCAAVGAAVEQPASIDSASTIKKNLETVFWFIENSIRKI